MSDPQPFVVQPPGDGAHHAAVRAAIEWDLPSPVLLRTGMNALFTAGDDVVLRVSRTTAPPDRAIVLARQLTDIGVRVPRFVSDTALVVDGLAVFAMERLHDAGQVDFAAVGTMVRRLHDAPPPLESLPSCESFPWWRTRALLTEVDDLVDDAARAGLTAAIDAHAGWAARVTHTVVCHGDVHPGNVVQTADGPVLLDWDLVCTGPAAWDHAPLMTWTERWGGAPGLYERFAEGYGRSLRGDPLAESIAAMRNVSATLLRLRAGRTDAAAAAEAARRLRFWRGEPGAPAWVAQ
jgi:hypothetical protein